MSGKYENAMLRQVLSVPELLEQVYPDVEPQVRYVLTTPQIFSVKKVVLTSCGDGYAACLAAKRAFERFLQIPIEVVEPLALSRYYQMKWVGESPCDPLVIAVSNSGQVTRVVEAVKRMREHNALTVAITSNPESPLGKAAEKVIVPTIPAFESSPGIRSYAVLQMIVYLLAIRMGEVRLKYTYIIKCEKVIKDADGKVTALECSYDPATRPGGGEWRSVKGTIHWVSAAHAKEIEIRNYDRLFTLADMSQVPEDRDYKEFLNPESLVVASGLAEPALLDDASGIAVQFERTGYYVKDKDSTPEKPVFNKTVSLKDSYRPE